MTFLPLPELRKDGFAGGSLSNGLLEVKMHYLTVTQLRRRI